MITGTNMASTLEAIAPPTMDFSKIRKTSETPPRVSVIDLIAVVTTNNNPRDDWKKLRTSHPETVANSYSYKADYKFPGRGNQTTPVINARGAIMIINLLPGSMAASFRAAWADIIVRYIAGDPTLAAEIERNNAMQNEVPDEDPRRFFGQDVEARHIPKSVTGVQDIRSAQIYFGIAGPPEVWTDIRRSDGTPYMLKENEFLIKAGYHDENTGRYGQHVSEYGFFRLSDSVLGRNPRLAEQKMKGWLRNENLLLSARHVNKTTRDTELIAVTLARYKEAVGKAIEFFGNDDNKSIDIDYERELTKRMEEETKRMQMQTEVQKMQIQLEMMKLSQENPPAPAHTTAEPLTPSRPRAKIVSPDNGKFESFVRQNCVQTASNNDRIIYSDLLRRYKQWSGEDEEETVKVRKAMEVFTGRKYSTQRRPENKALKGQVGWSRVRFT